MPHDRALHQAIRYLGSQAALARALGLSRTCINNWLNRNHRIPLEYAIAIEKLTQFTVSCYDLAPHARWLARFLKTPLIPRLIQSPLKEEDAMSKIRTIKPEFFRHEWLFEVERQTQLPLRLAFIGLFTCCDSEGRFRWRARQLKLDILPYDEMNFEVILNALHDAGFIQKYQDGGEEYGYIPSWSKHQHINAREPASKLPAPSLCTLVPAVLQGTNSAVIAPAAQAASAVEVGAQPTLAMHPAPASSPENAIVSPVTTAPLTERALAASSLEVQASDRQVRAPGVHVPHPSVPVQPQETSAQASDAHVSARALSVSILTDGALIASAALAETAMVLPQDKSPTLDALPESLEDCAEKPLPVLADALVSAVLHVQVPEVHVPLQGMPVQTSEGHLQHPAIPVPSPEGPLAAPALSVPVTTLEAPIAPAMRAKATMVSPQDNLSPFAALPENLPMPEEKPALEGAAVLPLPPLHVQSRCVHVPAHVEMEVEMEREVEKEREGEGEGVQGKGEKLMAAIPNAPRRGAVSSPVIQIFEFWKTTFYHPGAKLDPKRRRLIQQALKLGYTPEQLQHAILGCAYTPHNQGDNPQGQRYDGLHVILRDADQIERFMGNFHHPPKAHPDRQLHHNLQAVKTWLQQTWEKPDESR